MQFPPGKGSLQPVAIGAAAEVTTLSEAFGVEGCLKDDLASMQAVTRVNAEQASKRATRKPTWLNNREGRCCGETSRTSG